MKLVVLGPPGAGKGTQAGRISEAFSIPRITTGDMLREEAARGSELGREVEEYMKRGVLVPDQLVLEMVASRLNQPDVREGFVLDGFPRTIEQAKALEGLAVLDAVVAIDVPERVAVERLAGRRSCRRCQAVYHLKFSPPQVEGRCDRCGGELFQRADDREEVVKERFRTYRKQTKPLLAYYRDQSLLEVVEGSGSVHSVQTRILEALASRGLAVTHK